MNRQSRFYYLICVWILIFIHTLSCANPVEQLPSKRNSLCDPSTRDTPDDKLIRNQFCGYLDSCPRCLKDPNDYTKGFRPIDIKIKVLALKLQDVDEMGNAIILSVRMELSWNDCRLGWRPSEFSNIQEIEIPKDLPMWTPDITWLERVEKDFDWHQSSRASLDNSGRIHMHLQALLRFSCEIELTDFPFDQHNCELTFMPVIHSADEMKLTVFFWAFADTNSTIGTTVGLSASAAYEDSALLSSLNSTSNTSSLANELASDQWRVTFQNSKQSTCENRERGFQTQFGLWEGKLYSQSVCRFRVVRRPLYHIFSIMLPASLITLISALAFLIPPTEPDEKITLSVTILLALIVFLMQMYQQLPVTGSGLPLLSQYFTALIFLVSLSCLLTVVVAYVHWLGEEQIEVKRFMRRTILRTLGPILVPQHFKNLSRLRQTFGIEGDGKGKDMQEGGEQFELKEQPKNAASATGAANKPADEAQVSKRLLEKKSGASAASEKKDAGGEEFADPSAPAPEGCPLGIEPAAPSPTPHVIHLRSRRPSQATRGVLGEWPRSLMRLHFVPRSWRLEHRRTMYPSRPRSMASAVAYDQREGDDAGADSLAAEETWLENLEQSQAAVIARAEWALIALTLDRLFLVLYILLLLTVIAIYAYFGIRNTFFPGRIK